jgi:hypothetical protein
VGPRGGIITMLITVAAMALVATAFGFWAASPHSPALRGDMAAALIAARPEFNNYASLLMVSQTTRGADSMNTCCYMAAFTFRQHGSTKAIDGRADFFFYDKEVALGQLPMGPASAR